MQNSQKETNINENAAMFCHECNFPKQDKELYCKKCSSKFEKPKEPLLSSTKPEPTSHVLSYSLDDEQTQNNTNRPTHSNAWIYLEPTTTSEEESTNQSATPLKDELEFRSAPIGNRLTAKLIDISIIAIVGAAILPGVRALVNFYASVVNLNLENPATIWAIYSFYIACGLALVFLYSTIMTGVYSATLGKAALGIRVVNTQGGTPGFLRSIARFLMEGLAAVSVVSYIFALIRKDNRAFHDILTGTFVVKIQR